MKISRIEVFSYDVAYNHGIYTMSHGRAQTSEPSLVVKVTAGDFEGWGETCPHGGNYLPGFYAAESAALGIFGRRLIGVDPRQSDVVQQAMADILVAGMGAKSALDIACLDIAGKAAGVPASFLLGGRMADRFRVWDAVPLAAPDVMAAYVARSLTEGTTVFQVKVGNDPFEDVARVNAVMNLLGPEHRVVADANGGWNLQDATIAARELADLRIFIEQPCLTIENCGAIRQHSGLPLILDECVVTLNDLVRGKREAGAGGINIKPSRVGGITPARRLRDAAVALGMMVTIDDTWGGAIITAALSQLAVSTPPEALLAVSFFSEWVTPLIADGPRKQPDGRGTAPNAPGLGVSVDEALLGDPVLSFDAD